MARILAIDFGKKRCGLAVTDPEQIIAGALTTVATNELMSYLKQYVSTQKVETIVMGLPRKVNGDDSETMAYIRPFLARLRKEMPQMNVEMYDERFTTKLAFDAMLAAGLKKTDRNNKNGVVDKVSATIILQSYMESKR